MKSAGRKRLLLLAALLGLVGVYVSVDSRLVTGADSYAKYDRALEAFNDAFTELSKSYFKELDPGNLTDSAIEGMLEDLDPNTQFYDRRALDQLNIRTRGKFGGLGISISKKGIEVPVVMSVFEGTPADTSGLRVGDRIAAVEGDPTHGKDLQDVVDVLRGTEGTPVVITVERPGGPTFDQHIIRDRISINSVGLAVEVGENIGYISMSGALNSHFSENTGRDLERALLALNADRLDGLVLDLRSNPGGLLSQAVAVADKFLPARRLVVSTRGRDGSQNQEYHTQEPAAAGSVPLVVLVNGQSASASEIVAGAIQDSDRGLILGTTTFGKGSVQTIRPIGEDQEKALKLTTAVYYTPSGRSIHRTGGHGRRGRRMFVTLHDTLRVPVWEMLSIIGQAERREVAVTELVDRYGITTDDAEGLIQRSFGELVGLGLRDEDNRPEGTDPKEAYKTAGGRTVYGGGGITPDVKLEAERPPRLVIEMARRFLFFDFVVDYASRRTFPATMAEYAFKEGLVDSFLAFVADTSNTGGYRYQSMSEYRLHELESSLKDHDLTPEQKTALGEMAKAAAAERQKEIDEAREAIRLELKKKLALRAWGEKASQLVSLEGDAQYEEALRILKDRRIYRKKMKLALAGGGPGER